MAKIHSSIAAFLLILNVLLISAELALSGREIPVKDSKNLDKKQPESFIGDDGSVLIPGIGRYVFPRPGTHFDPISYNPITGTNGGNGLPGSSYDPFTGTTGGNGQPGSGSGSNTGHSYIPGGDDTYVPNPGEVPIGGSTPASARP